MKTMANDENRNCEILRETCGEVTIKGQSIPGRFFLLEEIQLVNGQRRSITGPQFVNRWWVRGEVQRDGAWIGNWKGFKSREEAELYFVQSTKAAGVVGKVE